MPGPQDYIDRGVQTDFPQPSDLASVQQAPYDVEEAMHPTSDTPSTSGSSLQDVVLIQPPELDDAYTYCLAANNFIPDHSSVIYPLPASHIRKYTKLPHNRPSEMTSSSQRVVSLPEALSSYKKDAADGSLRTVSLSERPRPSVSENTSSSEIEFQDTSQRTSLDDEDRYHPRDRIYPHFDLPQTPSPPSSPESVMIIGNNTHVPASFLRHEPLSQNIYADDGGWITWASSPPRPIPALHGPLSLPYARCPSGAEGTIIEGDDLSRMIWGLHMDNTAPNQPHVSVDSLSPKAKPRSAVPPRLQNFQSQLQSFTHIQPLSKDATPNSTYSAVPSTVHTTTLHGCYTLDPSRSFENASSMRAQTDDIKHQSKRPLTAPQYPPIPGQTPTLDKLFIYDQYRNLTSHSSAKVGLGLGHDEKTPDNLKASAPVFVPAAQCVPNSQPRIFVEPRLSSRTVNSPRMLSAIEIAQQYRAKHQFQGVQLPTPPNSSSPQWTPRLGFADDFSPYNYEYNAINSEDSASLRYPHYQHSLLANEHRLAEPQYAQQYGLGISPSLTANFASDSNCPAQNIPQAFQNDIFTALHPGQPSSAPFSAIPHYSQAASLKHKRPATLPELSFSPPSPENRPRNVSLQQPRSIPLARLVQRRLASVPEEDSSPPIEYGLHQAPSLGSHLTSAVWSALSQVDHPPSGFRPAASVDHRNARTPSPAENTFSPQTISDPGPLELSSGLKGLHTDYVVEGKTGMRPTVKLPLNTANVSSHQQRQARKTGLQNKRQESDDSKENQVKTVGAKAYQRKKIQGGQRNK